MQITGDTLIGQVLERYPALLDVFEGYGLPCAACLAYSVEPIRIGARRHGARTAELVAELNRRVGELDRVAEAAGEAP